MPVETSMLGDSYNTQSHKWIRHRLRVSPRRDPHEGHCWEAILSTESRQKTEGEVTIVRCQIVWGRNALFLTFYKSAEVSITRQKLS
jgi:hypothetical protein